MLELLSSVDPMALPLWAVLLFSISMYPLGFMFGAECSLCCKQCRDDTCEGFDLEEAFSCRSGGQSWCFSNGDIEYLGDGKFAIDLDNSFDSYKKPVRKGCWAQGAGFAGKVIKAEWEFPYEYEFTPATGCCQISYDLNVGSWPNYIPWFERTCENEVISVQSVTNNSVKSEAECDAAFAAIDDLNADCVPAQASTFFGGSNSQVVENKQLTFTECLDCNGNATTRKIARYLNRPELINAAGYGRWVVTVDAEIESVDGCVTFCGQSGLCGAPRRLEELEYGGGPYGSDPPSGRRMCMRWLCRCYEGTGKKNLRTVDLVTASAPGGTGATFDINFRCSTEECEIDSVTLLNGGAGYSSSGYLAFSGATELFAPVVFFECGRIAPTIAATAGGSGSGASLSPTVTSNGSVWGVSSVNIINGGSGYSVNDPVLFSIVDGEEANPGQNVIASGAVSATGAGGAITAVQVDAPGEYFKTNGIIESIRVDQNGVYAYELQFPDPADWYTVKSTSAEIGGPPLFGGSLVSKLEAATEVGQDGWTYNKLEHQYLFGETGVGENSIEWPAEDGDVICSVYAFGFYGGSGDPPPIACENPERNQPKVVTPQDVYVITPCGRCSCQ